MIQYKKQVLIDFINLIYFCLILYFNFRLKLRILKADFAKESQIFLGLYMLCAIKKTARVYTVYSNNGVNYKISGNRVSGSDGSQYEVNKFTKTVRDTRTDKECRYNTFGHIECDE